MPYLVTCPNCGSKLKSGQPVPAGRNLSCPQCKAAFTLSAPAPEVDAQTLTAPQAPAQPAPARPAAPAPATAPTPPTPHTPAPPPMPAGRKPAGAADASPQKKAQRDDVPVAKIVDDDDRPRARSRRDDDDDDRPTPRRGRDDEEDDRPRSRRQDEDDDRPRSRRGRDDEDDDRPRSRRRPDDDEEDDRPKSRRERDDEGADDRPARGRRPADEDEDQPRSRRARDDDEEEERPRGRKARAAADDDEEGVDRPRRGRAGKKKGKGMLVGLLAGAAALLFLCGGGAALYFADPFGWFGGGASSDMLAWMPADTQSVQGIDFDQVNKYPKALSATRQEIRDAEAVGIKAEDVSSSMQAKKTSNNVNEVTVVKLKSSADKDKISKAAGGQEATANGKKYYKTNGGGALYFASDRIVVITRSENTMTGLLQKEDGKVVISKDLQDCVKKADGHLWIAGLGSDANMFGGGDMGNMGKGGFPGMTPIPQPKWAVMNAKFTSDEVTIKAELEFADAETAKRAKESIEGMFNMVKGFMDMAAGFAGKGGPAEQKKLQDAKKMFESLKVTQSGSTVTITMTGPIDAAGGLGKGGGFGGM